MNIENLVKMANDIGNFFSAESDIEVATQSIAEHIRKFWDPRMRQAIIAHNQKGGAGLNELPRAAIAGLANDLAALREVGDG
ncbi:formate dehydrogenase subunit delta [Methylocaldum sp. MU1018]